mmetsp:Transcript_20576/g.28413  ORF Transcript_20576/g.28413 Transcript_20576/m.28413 type:complete len:107 (+) Transcript_20576:220-540(+)
MNNEDNGLEEVLVINGIGNALKVFRSRGMLGKETHFGRNKDQNLTNQLSSFNKNDDGSQQDDRVKLNYFDKSGRRLTIKEAFRQMCWKFHGRMPSHKKQEKMRKKE